MVWGFKVESIAYTQINVKKIEFLSNRVVGTVIVWKTNHAKNAKYDYKMGNDHKVEFQNIKSCIFADDQNSGFTEDLIFWTNCHFQPWYEDLKYFEQTNIVTVANFE